MAKNFRELQAKRDPESRTRVEALVRQAEEEMLQTEIHKMMQQNDPHIFTDNPEIQKRIEAQDDLPWTMLQRIVQRLGGQLELVLKLPNQTVHFPPSKDAA